jgi:hypothetical protein
MTLTIFYRPIGHVFWVILPIATIRNLSVVDNHRSHSSRFKLNVENFCLFPIVDAPRSDQTFATRSFTSSSSLITKTASDGTNFETCCESIALSDMKLYDIVHNLRSQKVFFITNDTINFLAMQRRLELHTVVTDGAKISVEPEQWAFK